MKRYALWFVAAFIVAMTVTILVTPAQAAEATAQTSPLSGWAAELVELVAYVVKTILALIFGWALQKWGSNWSEETKSKAMSLRDRLAAKAAGLAEEWAAAYLVTHGVVKKGEEKLEKAAATLQAWTGGTIEQAREDVQAALPFVGMGATAKETLPSPETEA